MDRYFDEYDHFEDTIDVRAGKRFKKKNHKVNSRGLKEVGNIWIKRANEIQRKG